jgi:hypothetical protein
MVEAIENISRELSKPIQKKLREEVRTAAGAHMPWLWHHPLATRGQPRVRTGCGRTGPRAAQAAVRRSNPV